MLEKLKTYLSLTGVAFLFIYPAWHYLFGPDRTGPVQSDTEKSFSLVFPVEGASLDDVISDFGDPRGRRRHEGIDIRAPGGTPVLAVTAGIAHRVKSGGNGGKQVWLKSPSTGLTFYYAHLQEQWVREGQKVRAGQAIGSVGNTGNASKTRPHLHFEVHRHRRKATNPVPLLSGEELP